MCIRDSYEPEALKAQAVCARSYACIQLLRGDLAEYGAHIDDSTAYQVYNRVTDADAAREAVIATQGEVLSYQGNIVEAYYFSTSMGYTAAADVWNVEDPAEYEMCIRDSPYQAAAQQPWGLPQVPCHVKRGGVPV